MYFPFKYIHNLKILAGDQLRLQIVPLFPCAADGSGPLIPCKPPVSQSLGSLFLLFSPCCEAVCHFFSALYFFRAPLPAARFPRGNPAYFFPLEAKRPSAPCFAPAVLFPFSSIPACPLSYPVRFPFASPRSLFRLSPQCQPPVVTALFPFAFPARSSAFCLNAILSVVTFPLHVTFPCSRFRLSPQSRPSVVTSLFPLAFPACAFLFPNPVFTAEKGSKKSPSLTEKASCLRLFPIQPIKKPSRREL